MTHSAPSRTDNLIQASRLRDKAQIIRYRALFADESVYRQECDRAAEMESEALALERTS